MSTTRRSCIEVDTGTSGRTDDPVGLFARMLRVQHGGTKQTEESNRKLLESLIRKGQIPRSNIIWHEEKVSKIYGFKMGNDGKIEYNSPNKSPPKKVPRAYVTDVPEIDISVLKDAILRSKQMAI